MKDKLIFGSTAAKHWFPDFPRNPQDLDYISKNEFMSRNVQHYWQEGFQYVFDNNLDHVYVDANFLYTIKVSHAAWDVKWDKTMFDIQFFQNKECVLDYKLYQLLYKNWQIIHKNKEIHLTKNDEFFKDAVKREFRHDVLHELLKFNEEPIHNKIRPDSDKSFCSEFLWNKLSHQEKLKCAMEEIYVVATERYINKYPPKFSKNKAIKNLILTMTKGWFNLFLIDNYHLLLKFDDTHWLNKLKELQLVKR